MNLEQQLKDSISFADRNKRIGERQERERILKIVNDWRNLAEKNSSESVVAMSVAQSLGQLADAIRKGKE